MTIAAPSSHGHSSHTPSTASTERYSEYSYIGKEEDREAEDSQIEQLNVLPDEVLSEEAILKIYNTFEADLKTFAGHPTVVFEHLINGLRRAYAGGMREKTHELAGLRGTVEARERELRTKDLELQGKDRLLEQKDRELELKDEQNRRLFN